MTKTLAGDILGIVLMLAGVGVAIYGTAGVILGHAWYVPFAATGGAIALIEAGRRVILRNYPVAEIASR